MTTRRIPLSKVRNIGIVAHVDAGKTTLTERILWLCGVIHGKPGVVHDGTTHVDVHHISKARKITIVSAAVTCPWRDHEIHLIDTPGHVDFAVEVERCLRVLDGAVVVLDAVAGVEPQTESVWRRADRRRLPRIVFVNKLDRAGADFDRCVDEVRTRLGANAVVLALPWYDGADNDVLLGTLDVVHRRALRWRDDGDSGFSVEPLSQAQAAQAAQARAALIAALADVDERVLALVVDGRDVADDLVVEAVAAATRAGALVPVLCGAAYKGKGVEPLLDAVLDLLPAPAGTDEAPLLAAAFKTVHDKFGPVTFVRVVDGVLEPGSSVVSARTSKRVRVGRIVRLFADKRVDIDAAFAGDIAGLAGIAIATGDSLCDPDHVVALEQFTFDPPVVALAIEPATAEARDQLGVALSRLVSEDPSLVVRTDEDTGETTLAGMGELHLEVAVEKLRTDHKVDVVTGKPKVAYRETLTREVTHRVTWKKQTGGPGQFAVVELRLEPGARGSGFTFVDEVRGGAIPKVFIPCVEDGVRDALARGVVAGHPVVDVVVAVTDGDFHEKDSKDIAFRLCAAQCFLEAAKMAAARVLEPVMSIDVTVPEDRVGDVVGDVLRRRGVVNGIEPVAGNGNDRVVRAEAPLAEMFGYASDLRSRTQGRGTFTMTLARHDFAPM